MVYYIKLEVQHKKMTISTTAGQENSKSLARQIVAWASKGEDVSRAIDGEHMASLAKLDWDVKIYPIHTPGGYRTKLSQAVKTDRDGSETMLSIVPSKNWKVLDNASFCNRAIGVAESFGGSVSRAGWVKKETEAVSQTSFLWAMISPGLGIQDAVTEGYEGIKPIILLTSGTSYSCGYSCKLLFVRSVCQNGLVDSQATTLRTTHQTTAGAFANFTIEEVRESVAQYARQRELLLNTQIDADAAYAWFIHHYSKNAEADMDKQPEKLRMLWDIYNGEMDNHFADAGIDLAQAKIRGTYYGLLQSVVAFSNHFSRSRSDNAMIEIINGDRAAEMQKIRDTLTAAATRRAANTVQVAVRAW